MKRYSFYIKLLVSLGLLGFLFHKTDLAPLEERLNSFKPGFYLLGVLLIFAYVSIQSVILGILLHSRGHGVPVWRLARLTIMSNFFGVFLPGGSGTDVVLCWQLFKSSCRKETVLSAIIFARAGTLLGMIAIAFAASFSPICPVPGLGTVSFIVLVSGAILYAVLAWKRSANVTTGLSTFLNRYRPTAFIYRTVSSLIEVSQDRRALLLTVPLFIVIGVVRVFLDYFAALALGLEIPLIYFFCFSPVVMLAGIVPLTLAGLGVREGTYIGLMATVGIAGADAMSVSLTAFSFLLCLCLVGAIMYVASGMKMPSADNPGTEG